MCNERYLSILDELVSKGLARHVGHGSERGYISAYVDRVYAGFVCRGFRSGLLKIQTHHPYSRTLYVRNDYYRVDPDAWNSLLKEVFAENKERLAQEGR